MRDVEVELAIAAAGRPEDLWHTFERCFVGTVVNRIIYLHFPPPGAVDAFDPQIWADGFPEMLVSRYMDERMYRDNPAISIARTEIEPVFWIDILSRDDLTPRETAFVENFRKANLGFGVGIPVYGPNGRDGHCGLGFLPGVERVDLQTLRGFRWVCQLAHLRYCSLLLPSLGPMPRLSEREHEVLQWVARGKSNALIGEILGISPHTVNSHLRRICLKLGVSDRISAAVRGIGVGLIHAAA